MSRHERVIADNVARVQDRIAAACRRCGRNAGDVQLVAVTKSADIDHVQALVDLGVCHLGESRPQRLVERAAIIKQATMSKPVRWHLVGHLQRNKVRKVLPVATLIHSVDALPILVRIDEIAGELNLRPRVLLEVNVSGEASKDGFQPAESTAILATAAALRHAQVVGLMTMAPLEGGPDVARSTFAGLRRLRDQWNMALADMAGADGADGRGPVFRELSMGMSGDFEEAIDEGATTVRVGTALFEGLPADPSDDRA